MTHARVVIPGILNYFLVVKRFSKLISLIRILRNLVVNYSFDFTNCQFATLLCIRLWQISTKDTRYKNGFYGGQRSLSSTGFIFHGAHAQRKQTNKQHNANLIEYT